MSPRVLAASVGLLGGLLLAVAGGLSFLARESADWHETVALVGYAGALLALAATGYALVARAPVWLRLIVSIAFPLLIASVWQVVDQALDDQLTGWRAPATTHLLAGVLLVVATLLALRSGTSRRGSGHVPTHR